MRRPHRTAVNDAPYLLGRKRGPMALRNPREIRDHDFQRVRDRPIAEPAQAMAAGAESLIQLGAAVSGKILGATTHAEQQRQCRDRGSHNLPNCPMSSH
jgi:hypothetical protein